MRRMEHQTAAIYCRLSVSDDRNEKEESQSIQNQKLFLMDYAKKQNFMVYKIYSDEDFSGLDELRPAFHELLVDAQKGLFEIVICKTLSRFTRDRELLERYLHGIFPLIGVRFISVVDGIDTDYKNTKKAGQLYGLINEWYSEDLSENIRAVFLNKMKAGQYIGSFAPYGYLKIQNDRHRLCIDEEAAKIVKYIFESFIEKQKYVEVSRMLYAKKIPNPTAYKIMQGLTFSNPNACSNSYHWSSGTIKKILQNQIYIGTLIQGQRKKLSYKSKKVLITPQSEWISIPNHHEPIINKNLFEKAQSLIIQKNHNF